MSGVMVQAGHARRPVIASDEGLIAWTTRKYSLGVTVDLSSPAQVIEGLRRLMFDKQSAQQWADNAHRRFSGHTRENFARRLLRSFDDNAPVTTVSGDGTTHQFVR